MTEEALYERYKSALRVGHVAAVRGRYEAAVAAYAEAATLAPDRPLPHASMGRALLRLDRADEALAAFATALRLAPRDETSLAGRADALAVAGRPAEAAGVLDLLAETQEASGHLPEACDTARRALELAESRSRRRHLEALVTELRTWPAERGGEEHLARAIRTLQAPIDRPARSPGTDPELADAVAGSSIVAPVGLPVAPGSDSADREPRGAGAELDSALAPDAGLESGLEVDSSALSIAVESAVATGDPALVHEVVLDAVRTMRQAGLLDAAIDACQLALTVAPADPDLHLALAELDLDHGWTEAAADKLVILERYVVLTDNRPARERLRELVAARIPDDERLSALLT